LRAPTHFFHLAQVVELLSFFNKDSRVLIGDDLLDNVVLMVQMIFGWILVMALGVFAFKVIMDVMAGLLVVYGRLQQDFRYSIVEGCRLCCRIFQ
jgi:hypothetical protein